MYQTGRNKCRNLERKQPTRLRGLMAFALLSTLILHPQIRSSWILLLRMEIRYEVRHIQTSNQLEKVMPVLLKIPVRWLKEEGHPRLIWTEADEFRYEGALYDVLSMEQHGDTLWYYCHHDKAETSLMNGLFEEIETDAPATASAQLKWTPGFLFEEWQVSSHSFSFFLIKHHRLESSFCYQDGAGRIGEPPTPPPPKGILLT